MRKAYLKLSFLFFVVLTSCTNQEPVKLSGNVFGTTYNIIYYGSQKNHQNEILKLFKDFNQSLSTYQLNSDISKINNGDTTVQIDAYFKEVFQKSARIYKETDGYFDPTVGSLVNAWGFGPEKPLNNLDTTTIHKLMKSVGFSKVALKGNLVSKANPSIYFDFNAIAKGYGIDVVGRFLEEKGIKNYLVEIGGEVRVRGTKPENKLWVVQLDSPINDGTRKAYDYLKLTNISMASSGNYRKFRVTKNGEKFVHTINPKTGFAKESNLLAATVMAKLDCADVDAYATAFMAMGLEKAKQFVRSKPELKVILIYADKNGKLQEYRN